MSGTLIRRLCIVILLIALGDSVFSQSRNPETESRAKWDELQKKPPTEQTFRMSCDLLQQVGGSDIHLFFRLAEEYLPIVKKSGNRRWIHIILMVLAKTKESMGFYQESEAWYKQVQENAGDSTLFLRSLLVGRVILYVDWGAHPDSSNKYFSIAEKQFIATNDKEALSFIYTFKALESPNDTAAVRSYLEKAIALASDLPDKNALFTARYNYTLAVLQNNPEKQIAGFEDLLGLARDSSLIPNSKLYSGRLYSFGLAAMSVYYQLSQLNLLLTDFANAGKYGQLFYDLTVKAYPTGPDIPYMSAALSIIKSYQGEYSRAREFADTSQAKFKLPEEKIPFSGYFIARGLLAEHDEQYAKALQYYEKAYQFGSEQYGYQLLPPGLLYAHALLLNHKTNAAEKVFLSLAPGTKPRKYTAFGYYYYQYYASLLKYKGDYPAYASALETFYAIKDSLSNLNRYHAIREIETRMRVHDEEQEIKRLNEAAIVKSRQVRRERIFYWLLIGLAGIAIAFLILYLRDRRIRERQKEMLQKSKIAEMEQQQHIHIMQNVMEAEENERRKIADQLHDEVNSMLALAQLNVSSTLEKGIPDEQSQKQIAKAQEILSTVTTTIRELSHRLTPFIIEKYGFRKAVEDLADTVNLSGRIKLELIIIGFEDSGKYAATLLNELYRIIQELLQNIVKHSRATAASLELVEQEGRIAIIVEDNGVGIKLTEIAKGKGLSAIDSKISYLKGKMEIVNPNEQGTLIVIELGV